jgi:hypothetical protein
MASPQSNNDKDYNIPSEERFRLLQRIQDALGDVPPTFWAAAHVCDIGKLLLGKQNLQLLSNQRET